MVGQSAARSLVPVFRKGKSERERVAACPMLGLPASRPQLPTLSFLLPEVLLPLPLGGGLGLPAFFESGRPDVLLFDPPLFDVLRFDFSL